MRTIPMMGRVIGLVFLLFLNPPTGITCGAERTGGAGETLGAIDLLPGDGDIPAWSRSGEVLRVTDEEGLYRHMDGGAGLFIKHGFCAYIGQQYMGPKGSVLEVAVYDQGSGRNARELYEDPLVTPHPNRPLEGLGEEARLDESGLFHHGVEFIQGRYYVRVIVQDKSEEGLKAAIDFGRHVSRRIR